jgi:hypothetical protein
MAAELVIWGVVTQSGGSPDPHIDLYIQIWLFGDSHQKQKQKVNYSSLTPSHFKNRLCISIKVEVPKSWVILKSLRGREFMMLITITNWKRKAAVVLKFLFFLLLIGLIIPQFLTFIAGGLADINDNESHYMRVEKGSIDKPREESNFLERLRQFYYGREPGSTR